MTYTKESKHTWQFRWVTSQPGGVFPWVTTYPNLGKSLTGEYNPRWKTAVKRGVSATTPLTASISDQICTPSRYELYKTTGRWAVTGCYTYSGTPNVNLSLQQVAINQALVRFYQDIREQRNAFKGMTFLGELRESIGMIKSRFKSSAYLLDGYAKNVFRVTAGGNLKKISRKRGIRDAMRDIGNLYLELTFGWRPLLNDIKQASEAVLRLTGGEMKRRTVRGFGINSSSSESTYADVYNDIRFNYSQDDVQSCKVIYKGGLALNLYGEGLQASARGVMDTLGFSLEEFVPTVWELIPYSFVADYFSNVGGVLTAATTSTIDLIWVQRTIVDHATRVFTATGNVPLMKSLYGASYVGYEEDPGVGYGWKTSVSRIPLTPATLGVPSFELRLPAADSLAWVNTLMLGVQKALSGASRNLNIRR